MNVTKSELYNVDIQVLWDLVTEPRALEKFHPFCKENRIITWSDDNRSDCIVYANDKVFTRNFTEWREKSNFVLDISDGNYDATVEWRIDQQEDWSKLTITIIPKFLPKNFLIRNLAKIYVRRRLMDYLSDIFKGIEYYIGNNKKVPLNHFGTHKWFS